MSIEIDSLAEILKRSERSLDLQSHFNNKKTWKSKNKISRGTLKWLGFHAEPYFSPFRPCFLFELDSTQSLEYFSPLQCRDGALTLLQFFFKNPLPLSQDSLLLVQEKLENLIPPQWQSQCLLYKKVAKPRATKTTAPRKLILMNSALGSKHCSHNFLEKFLQSSAEQVSRFDQICFVNFASYNLDGPGTRDSMVKHQFENFLQVSKNFSGKIELKSPLDFISEDLSNSSFLDLNEFNFYYSDSAFEDLILCRGASPLQSRERAGALYHSDLSFYHQIQLFRPRPKLNLAAAEIKRLFYNSNSITELEKNHKPELVDSDTKLTTEAFEDYAYDFAVHALDSV